MTIQELEKLLDSRSLEIQMSNGNWWAIRRNGATKRWKREPSRFQIPIKAGLHSYGYLDNLDLNVMNVRIKA